MKRKLIATLIVISMCLVSLAGCGETPNSPTAVPTETIDITPTAKPTEALPSSTETPVITPEETPTIAPTDTPIPTAEPIITEAIAATASPTPEAATTNTPGPTVTNTPVPTATNTPTPTATNTPKPTATNTPKPTATNTPKPTATNTPKPTATNTPTTDNSLPNVKRIWMDNIDSEVQVGDQITVYVEVEAANGIKDVILWFGCADNSSSVKSASGRLYEDNIYVCTLGITDNMQPGKWIGTWFYISDKYGTYTQSNYDGITFVVK